MKIVCKTENGYQEYSFELRGSTQLEEKMVVKAADIITSKMLQKELGFSDSKMSLVIKRKIFPFVTIGSSHITTRIQLEEWFRKNAGKEVRL